MYAVISSTYDDKYLYFLPIVTWCWNKLNVDVICFMPVPKSANDTEKLCLVVENQHWIGNFLNDIQYFSAPEHKEATYAQCSRLYAGCLDLPEDEWLVTSDVDMVVFNKECGGVLFAGNPNIQELATIVGYDLTPPNQYPMCYAVASVKGWRDIMQINGRTVQQCLDDELGNINAEHFKGNFWSRDQELLFNNMNNADISLQQQKRSNGQNQFAQNRLDRDDAYILERDIMNAIDFHLPRPGYEPHNFGIILTILQKRFPEDNFDWLIEFTNEYKKIL